jgi:citrate lyase subunit beta/citryl-CoA lyase
VSGGETAAHVWSSKRGSGREPDLAADRPVLTWLYVPGDRPDRFDRAVASSADVVVIDLEDAVAPHAKEQARRAVACWLPDAPARRIEVRINAVGTPWASADLEFLPETASLRGVRLPKIEGGAEVEAVAAQLPPKVGIHCLIESARGLEAAYEIAAAPRVTGVGLGEADLRADLGIPGSDGLSWARSRLVVAARAARLPAPAMAAYTDITNLDGLADACRRARALGMLGASALHPSQLPVIVEAFLPDVTEIRRAQQIVLAAAEAVEAGHGVFVLPDGRMVDAAVLASAQRVLALAPPGQS